VSYFGLTFGEYPGAWWGRVEEPAPIQLRGGYGPDKRRTRKQREFDEERNDREALRRFIERVLEPIETEAEVVTTTDAVAVLPRRGEGVALPVPPEFSAAAVTDAVMSVLRDNAVRAERVRTAEARERARLEVERVMAQIRRRRREEEWLLLMD
jgi:hypothetical protein